MFLFLVKHSQTDTNWLQLTDLDTLASSKSEQDVNLLTSDLHKRCMNKFVLFPHTHTHKKKSYRSRTLALVNSESCQDCSCATIDQRTLTVCLKETWPLIENSGSWGYYLIFHIFSPPPLPGCDLQV